MPHYPIFYRKKRFLLPLALILLLGGMIIWYAVDTAVSPPVIGDRSPLEWQVSVSGSGIRSCEGNWLRENEFGLWELYVHGSPFERGVANGKLTKELIAFQEEAFVNRLREMIPSDSYLKFLKYFIYWFNRDLDEYLMPEFKEEIYGISFSADPRYNFIGSPYQRMLNYHSAHDIGHALQDLMLVGCTSFGVWDQLSADSSLIIGRNFDFYMGDAFAEEKIVCFEKPDNGYGFGIVTWGGMIGAVSGMNERGITVTINAGSSAIPFSARTPISLLAREILQYAATIDDAWQIALRRETFVSESLLIGSGDENRAVIIEKAPFGLALIESGNPYTVCANHFQGEAFREDPKNKENIRNSASLYRHRRVIELITQQSPMTPADVASVLRDRKGLQGRDIGNGNEKAVNQLIAHHSVIFQPSRLLMWVSTSPWQLGPYVCYDLNEIFRTFAPVQPEDQLTDTNLLIPEDPFYRSEGYRQFRNYLLMRDTIRQWLSEAGFETPDSAFIERFTATNPTWYEAWSLSGDLYRKARRNSMAEQMYRKALSLEVPRWDEKQAIIRKLVEVRDNQNTLTE